MPDNLAFFCKVNKFMINLLYKWLLSVFTKDKIGIIVRALLISAAKPVIKDIFNVEYQKKAYEFVKELAQRDDLKGWEKAEMFNLKFAHFLSTEAKQMSASMLNCLREMALAAYESETSPNHKLVNDHKMN